MEKQDAYYEVAIEAMSRSTFRYVGAVFKVHQVSSHVLMSPRFVSGQICNVIPFIVWRPDKVHGIDLCTSSESGTTRIVQAGTIYYYQLRIPV
jgi:hypothetical protein